MSKYIHYSGRLYRQAADPKVDIEFQKLAEAVVKALNAHVFGRSVEDLIRAGLLYEASDPGVYTVGSDLWRFVDEAPYRLTIQFFDKAVWEVPAEGYMSNLGGRKAIIGLPWVGRDKRDPDSKPFVIKPSRTQIGYLVHELIHFYDLQRWKGGEGIGYRKLQDPQKDPASYYNDPGEFNAYFQMTAAEIRQDAEDWFRKEEEADWPDLWAFIDWGTFASFKQKVLPEFSSGFRKHMNAKYQRKFDKRLYQLWTELRNQYR